MDCIGWPRAAHTMLAHALLLGALAPSALVAENMDEFAAGLLCEQDADCKRSEPAEVSPDPLVINNHTLPPDADRERIDAQRTLVPQGAYVTKDGAIASLDGEAVEVTPPERGSLHAPDHGAVEDLPVRGPVVITTPEGNGDE